LNYSSEPQSFTYSHGAGTELLSDKAIAAEEHLQLTPWDAAIIEER
jgi:beta-galactosidase